MKNLAIIALAAGAFALLWRYQVAAKKTITGSQYGANWEPMPQDLEQNGGNIIYV